MLCRCEAHFRPCILARRQPAFLDVSTARRRCRALQIDRLPWLRCALGSCLRLLVNTSIHACDIAVKLCVLLVFEVNRRLSSPRKLEKVGVLAETLIRGLGAIHCCDTRLTVELGRMGLKGALVGF